MIFEKITYLTNFYHKKNTIAVYTKVMIKRKTGTDSESVRQEEKR